MGKGSYGTKKADMSNSGLIFSKKATKIVSAICTVVLIPALVYCVWNYLYNNDNNNISIDAGVPAYTNQAYVEVNNNMPYFEEDEYSVEPFEIYSELDELGRCGVAYANICKELMPTEERGSIGSVKPSGWHTVKYPELIKDLYLYNRCHLIGFQLAGENANKRNLITGTRYLNVEGMLPFEDMVADYVRETDNHVLYRVTPVFEGKNLVADGVLMEAYSVEDSGKGVCFCVFVYNVQPGIEINYLTGESKVSE